MSDVWDTLLAEARKVHQSSVELMGFCPFPEDVRRQDVDPFHIGSIDLLQAETGLFGTRYTTLRDAFIAAAPHAHWRQTYKGTNVSPRFLDEFGCYCLIGAGGAFQSKQMSAWVVYMPAGLYYPWHQHPPEEMYFTLAGEGVFMREGCADETMREGQACLHQSNQPHALETKDHPIMAYVVWRNGFDTPPVLTHKDAT
jgi:quercetin dioxygenase-like cupin family protein